MLRCHCYESIPYYLVPSVKEFYFASFLRIKSFFSLQMRLQINLHFSCHSLSPHTILFSNLCQTVHSCHFHSHGERPNKPSLQCFLCYDPKVLVTKAVQKQVDRCIEGQQQMGNNCGVFHPTWPGVYDSTITQDLKINSRLVKIITT